VDVSCSALCRRSSRGRAFTLIEVVFALAVASFGLVSMLGLLCVGVQTAHEAISTTTEAEIAQQLANQLQLGAYSTVSSSPSTNFYFTQEGFATNAANAVYFANISAPATLTTPGGNAANSFNMKKVVISIWSLSAGQRTNEIPIEIANNGS
jgi:uncharacterized protein (TIGR02598 family)